MMRTIRRIAAAVMKLSVSSVTANSWRSPQRWQKSQKLPALNAVFSVRRRYVTAMRPRHFCSSELKSFSSWAATSRWLVSLST